jgi:hypothetical protein
MSLNKKGYLRRIVKDGKGEWKIGVLQKMLVPASLLYRFISYELPLFRSESSGL